MCRSDYVQVRLGLLRLLCRSDGDLGKCCAVQCDLDDDVLYCAVYIMLCVMWTVLVAVGAEQDGTRRHCGQRNYFRLRYRLVTALRQIHLYNLYLHISSLQDILHVVM